MSGTGQQTWGPAGDAEPSMLMSVREPREIGGVCLLEDYLVFENVAREKTKYEA